MAAHTFVKDIYIGVLMHCSGNNRYIVDGVNDIIADVRELGRRRGVKLSYADVFDCIFLRDGWDYVERLIDDYREDPDVVSVLVMFVMDDIKLGVKCG